MSTANIEPLARSICERQLRDGGAVIEADIPPAVDRLWHVVASQIEAGLIDDDGRDVAHSYEDGLEAFRDWRRRHPGG
jgi:hypothetical protein